MSVQPDQKSCERFKRLLKTQRLAHAYLFLGPAGSGKMATALSVAQMVNCLQDDRPCGNCPSCRKIASANHPDVHMIGSIDEESIKIDSVRQMLGRAGLRAYEAAMKVFIIKDAQRLTTEAANALLKTLEEPPPHTLIILTTGLPDACLDTIKSRCHTVRFFSADDALPDDKDKILDALLSRGGNDEYLKELSLDRKQAAQAMRVLYSFLKDALLVKAGAGAVGLARRPEELQMMAGRTMEDLQALKVQIVRVKSLIDENLNAKMALSLMRQRLWDN